MPHLPIGLHEGADAFESQKALKSLYLGLLRQGFCWFCWFCCFTVGLRAGEAKFKAAEEVLPLFWERTGVALVLGVKALDVLGVFTVRSK